ncbi:MAG: HEAT repeat domain-containing protein [Candidatus Eisenbacteria bacterium]
MLIPLSILIVIFAFLVLLVIASAVAAGVNRAHSSAKRRRLDEIKLECRELFLAFARSKGEGADKALATIEAFLSTETAEQVALSLLRLEAPGRSDVASLFEKKGLVSYFVNLARRGSKWNKMKAVRVLGELNMAVASAALYKALDDGDADVRNAAARALSKLKHPMAQSALIDVLGKHEEPVSSRIAAIFIEGGAASVPLLIKNMRNENWRARFWSAEILGELGDRRAEGALLTALKDVSGDVRAAAVKSLGKLGDRSVGGGVIPLLKDPEWFVRCHAAWTLGRLKDEGAVEELLDALHDSSWWTRKNALEALAEIGERALPGLMATLESDDRFARESALEALQKLGVEVSTDRRGGQAR